MVCGGGDFLEQHAQISCRACGMKSQATGALFSLFLGWWGFPWGLALTPIQIGRNVFGMAHAPESSRPSPQLERIVRVSLAANLAQTNAAIASASH
jgi:hypothetical protein